MQTLTVTSPAFPEGGRIPSEYSCNGKNDSPALAWSGIPPGVKSYAVVCEDPDAPSGPFTHWILYNIPGGKSGIEKGVPRTPSLPDGSMHGLNNFSRMEYGGPCPPPGKPHRYFFRIYALDYLLNLRSPVTKKILEQAMEGHILAKGELMGIFSR